MENKLTKKYGLPTAIAMVVGIVIGSGVFFKAQSILQMTGGNVPLGILAWLIGGAIMLSCALSFSVMATRYEKVSGLVDYAEATVGGGYAYFIGWFMASVYCPTLVSALAWLSARYTLVFINTINPDFAADPATGAECMALSLFFLVASYGMNSLSPKIAGHFQVSATVIKLIPLAAMGIVGLVVGLSSGTIAQNFSAEPAVAAGIENPLFAAVVSTAFAYEGWILAASINSELKNAKRNLPIALTLGSLIVIGIYVLYYVGVSGGASVAELTEKGATVAFINVFGSKLGAVLNLFVAISCLGTLNGLTLANTRGAYALAVRGRGPAPDVFECVNGKTNVPTNSAIMGLLFSAFWFVYFYGANLVQHPWFGAFCFDSSELPIVTLYAMYIPVFVMFAVRNRGEKLAKRFVLPFFAVCGSVFMVAAAFFAHGTKVFAYLIVFAVFMAVGVAADRKNKKSKVV